MLAGLLLPGALLLAACSTSAQAPASVATTTVRSADPLCERFAGIYTTWAQAWKRDVDLRLGAGVDLADAQERASRSLIEPFRRAVLAEVDRDAATAQDPSLVEAMSRVAAAPDEQSGYEHLAELCGAVGPIPEAR